LVGRHNVKETKLGPHTYMLTRKNSAGSQQEEDDTLTFVIGMSCHKRNNKSHNEIQ